MSAGASTIGMRAERVLSGHKQPRIAAHSWVRRTEHDRAIHSGFLLALCAFLIGQPFIREAGGALFWAFTAVAVLYAAATARPRLVPSLVVVSAVGVVMIGLSYANVLPDAWTTTYVVSIIPRQAFYVVLLYPLVVAAASMWAYAGSQRCTSQFLGVILVATGLIAPLAEYATGGGSVWSALTSVATGGLGNTRMLFYVAFSYVLLVGIRNVETARAWTLLMTAVMFAAFAFLVTAPQHQNTIALALLLLLAFSRPTRTMVTATVLIGIAGYALLVPFASNVYRLDPNSGYRLLTTRDALVATYETFGVGVGFGKEVVSGLYSDAGVVRDDLTKEGAMLGHQGVHNSFAQEAMRLGVIGALGVGWLFFVTCFPPCKGPMRERRHLAFVYCILLVSLAFNTALESPTYIVGVAFGVGYILAVKDSWYAGTDATAEGYRSSGGLL